MCECTLAVDEEDKLYLIIPRLHKFHSYILREIIFVVAELESFYIALFYIVAYPYIWTEHLIIQVPNFINAGYRFHLNICPELINIDH